MDESLRRTLQMDFKLSDETIKRCRIFQLTPELSRKFQLISVEFFHFLNEVDAVDFNVYFRVDHIMIEYMRKEEFSKELVGKLWDAMRKSERRLELHVLKEEHRKFEAMINRMRESKVKRLLESDRSLDEKVLKVFSSLSAASQMIVQGGIDKRVAAKVKESASFTVANLVDNDTAVATLSRMVTHDPTLYDHSASVAMLGAMVAMNCLPKSLNIREAELVAQCGLYHDVGKTCVPSAILNKPGRFTPEEFEVMKQHTVLGEVELRKTIEDGAPIDPIAARVACEHHEKFEGHGYPYGRRGRLEEDPENGIHIYSRIVTIADVYSALLMKRVYKPAYEPQDAIKIMAETAQKDYDPIIFHNFLKNVVTSLNFLQKKKRRNKEGGRILFFDKEGFLREAESDGQFKDKKPKSA